MHDVAEVQDTELKPLDVDPAGRGVCWMAHVPAVKTSTMPFESPPPGLPVPTATHAEADGHETPLR